VDPSTIKAILMLCAYQGANAVLGGINTALSAGQTIPVNDDPLVQDAGMQAKGLAVYAEAKVQYAVLVQAFEDATGIWPNPAVPSTAAKPAATSAARPATGTAAQGATAETSVLQALATNPNSAVAQLAQQILQLLVPVQAVAQAAATTAPASSAAVPLTAGS
jgi:hypothetical protein